MYTNGSKKQDNRNQKAFNDRKLNLKGDQMAGTHKSCANDNNSEQGGSSATMNPKTTAQDSPYNKYAGTTNLSAAEQQDELPGRGATETSSNSLGNALDRSNPSNTLMNSQKKKKDEHQQASDPTNRVKETKGENVELDVYEERREPQVTDSMVNNCKDGNTEGNLSSIVNSISSVVEKPNEEVTPSNEKSQGQDSISKDALKIRYAPHEDSGKEQISGGMDKAKVAAHSTADGTANLRITDEFSTKKEDNDPITPTENSNDDRKKDNIIKNVNILLLGETGVGKTTFINSLINSLDHPTLNSMLNAGEPKILVDAGFTISDENLKIRRVKFPANYPKRGESAKNERLDSKGESSTQAPVIYNLNINDENGKTKILNIIDTPGISDTRGEKMDKANFEKILQSIAELGELHAICIMLKPNQARFTPSFRYNIEGLLKQLHQDAIKNMLFCFTNTRSTLYRPGDTLATLHKYLETLKKEKTTDVLLKADKYNIFCFDNDCFRYVLAVNQGVYQKTDELDLLFSESWERNAKESKKLLARAECLPIHNVRDTLDINYTRKLISTLAKPLAEVAKNHLINMRHTEDYMQQIKELDKNKSKVQGQLKRRITVLVSQKLKKPRTVCRSQKCTKYLSEYNYAKKHSVCHDNCNQEYAPWGVRTCWIFQDAWGHLQATCRVCGCHSNLHYHEFYKLVEQEQMVTDSRAQAELHNLADRKALINLMLEEEKEKYKALEFEHNTIRDFCAEAAVFLLENSIHAGGDPYLIEIENLIRDEENKSKIGGDSQMFYEVTALQMQYQERVAALQEDIKGNRRAPLTSDQLMNMMDNLSVQKMCGEQIKQLKNLCEENIHEYETSDETRM